MKTVDRDLAAHPSWPPRTGEIWVRFSGPAKRAGIRVEVVHYEEMLGSPYCVTYRFLETGRQMTIRAMAFARQYTKPGAGQ